MKIDIFDATKMVAFEINGRQHSEYVPFFSKNRSGYLQQMRRDVRKYNWCQINKIVMVEINEEDLPLSREWFINKYGIYL